MYSIFVARSCGTEHACHMRYVCRPSRASHTCFMLNGDRVSSTQVKTRVGSRGARKLLCDLNNVLASI